MLGRLASRLGGAVTRGNTPFAAAAAGASGFRVIDVQSVAQDQADRWGSAFTDLFVVLGAFSLFSGMLLIVLVFSLVALERRTELGISRALGARRRDVILLLAIEGGLYSLISSLFGLGARTGAGAGDHHAWPRAWSSSTASTSSRWSSRRASPRATAWAWC